MQDNGIVHDAESAARRNTGMIYYCCHAKVFSSEKMILVPCESRLKGTRKRSLKRFAEPGLVGRLAMKEKESAPACAEELASVGAGT